MLTLCMLFVLLLGSFFFSCDSIASLSCVPTMAKWIRRWKPIWIPHGGNFQKAYVEESSWQPLPSTSAPKRKSPQSRQKTHRWTLNHWTRQHHRCVHECIHPVQYGIMPTRLSLPHPDEEIRSGCEEDVSFTQDGYTARVMTDPESTLERHLGCHAHLS